ncbi:MAG: hypothetical protein Q8L10_01475, partial [Candidatus Moranbacteria bacterium]|nr:hypothetical protein [Candidatus Moranbacteria bacterium]
FGIFIFDFFNERVHMCGFGGIFYFKTLVYYKTGDYQSQKTVFLTDGRGFPQARFCSDRR